MAQCIVSNWLKSRSPTEKMKRSQWAAELSDIPWACLSRGAGLRGRYSSGRLSLGVGMVLWHKTAPMYETCKSSYKGIHLFPGFLGQLRSCVCLRLVLKRCAFVWADQTRQSATCPLHHCSGDLSQRMSLHVNSTQVVRWYNVWQLFWSSLWDVCFVWLP